MTTDDVLNSDEFLDDGHGNCWAKCGPGCQMEIVRPGKVQCVCDDTDEYGMCRICGYRVGVSCTCGLSFAEKAKTVGIDKEALRRLHGR